MQRMLLNRMPNILLREPTLYCEENPFDLAVCMVLQARKQVLRLTEK